MPVPRSDREATRILIQRAQAGDREAMEQLLEEYRPFVMSIARRYANRYHPLADVMQEGLLGLVKAIERFDTSRDVTLPTYAFHWVRQSILRALPHEELIRYPTYIWEALEPVRLAQEALAKRLGRRPSLLWIARETGFTPKHLRRLFGAGRAALILDMEIGEEDEALLGDIIPGTLDTERIAESLFLADEVDKLLGRLSEIDRRVVRLYFGLDGGGERTLAEVAALEGVTRERIRQRLQKALKTLAERVENESS
jgi:RNA polymerase primary sigma factor